MNMLMASCCLHHIMNVLNEPIGYYLTSCAAVEGFLYKFIFQNPFKSLVVNFQSLGDKETVWVVLVGVRPESKHEFCQLLRSDQTQYRFLTAPISNLSVLTLP